MKKIFFALAILTVAAGYQSAAQPGNRQQISAEQMADLTTDRISEQIRLSEKQRKKVYKLYLKQAREIEKSMAGTVSPRPEGLAGQGMRGGGPQGMRGSGGMRGGPGGPRGAMSGGGPGSTGGMRPGSGVDRGERSLQNPGRPYEEPEKDLLKRDSKMKKILTPEQYEKWVVIEKEMQYERFRDEFMKLEPEKDGNDTR